MTLERPRRLELALFIAMTLAGVGSVRAAMSPWTPVAGAADVRTVMLSSSVREAEVGALLKVTAGGRVHDVVLETVDVSLRGVRSFRGAVPDAPGSFFLMTTGPDGATTALFGPSPAERWRLHKQDGVFVLEQVDAESFEPCAGALPSKSAARGTDPVVGAGRPDPDKAFGDAADDGSRHDILVAWTDLAEFYAGGPGQMEAEVQLAVDAANLVYANSGIPSRLRLVFATVTDYQEIFEGDYNNHAYQLQDPIDGEMDEIPALRNITGADFVVLFVESIDMMGNPVGSCGVGFVMGADDFGSSFEDRAYSVVSRRCASSVWTLAHEVGHNRGCAHNREDTSLFGVTDYAHGHRFTATDGQDYRTVMAYDTDPASMTRIPVFSHPGISHQGTPTGVAVGASGEAHNAQVHSLTDAVCAVFRPERTFVDFDWAAGSTGLVDAPFPTLAAGLMEARIGGQIVLKGSAPGFTPTLSEPIVLIHLGSTSSVLGAP